MAGQRATARAEALVRVESECRCNRAGDGWLEGGTVFQSCEAHWRLEPEQLTLNSGLDNRGI